MPRSQKTQEYSRLSSFLAMWRSKCIRKTKFSLWCTPLRRVEIGIKIEEMHKFVHLFLPFVDNSVASLAGRPPLCPSDISPIRGVPCVKGGGPPNGGGGIVSLFRTIPQSKPAVLPAPFTQRGHGKYDFLIFNPNRNTLMMVC